MFTMVVTVDKTNSIDRALRIPDRQVDARLEFLGWSERTATTQV